MANVKNEVDKDLKSVFDEESKVDNFSCGTTEFKTTNTDLRMLDIQIVPEEEDLKSLKVDLENCLQIQKDTVKSYLNIKRDVSYLKEHFDMVFGRLSTPKE